MRRAGWAGRITGRAVRGLTLLHARGGAARGRRFAGGQPDAAQAALLGPQRPVPVTPQRIGDDLARRGYRFRIDDDGDVTGIWDGNQFWFLLLGPEQTVFQVRGRWAATVTGHARITVLQAVNDWNREQTWPKVYVRDEDDGLALYTEVSVDFEQGATDDQLAATLTCGLLTASQFFGSLSVPTSDGS